MFLSHGSEDSRGVMILAKDKFDYDCQIQGHPRPPPPPFLFNIYSPNTTKRSVLFFEEIQRQLDEFKLEENCEVITGGDVNAILYADLDSSGDKPQVKESRKKSRICVQLCT